MKNDVVNNVRTVPKLKAIEYIPFTDKPQKCVITILSTPLLSQKEMLCGNNGKPNFRFLEETKE